MPRRLSHLTLVRPCNARRVAAAWSGSASRLAISNRGHAGLIHIVMICGLITGETDAIRRSTLIQSTAN
jgi:hypothetical protein